MRITEGTCISFAAENESVDGPDIAFMPISAAQMTSLSAISSVVDLDLQAQRFLTARPNEDYLTQVVAGAVHEFSEIVESSSDRTVLSVNGLLNVGRFIGPNSKFEFDYLTFQPSPDPEVPLPTSYGATSGGGMWELFVERNKQGELKFVQSRLSGVVYYETELPHRTLIGHGPASIYCKILPELYRRWRE